jgi:hypothetical protein
MTRYLTSEKSILPPFSLIAPTTYMNSEIGQFFGGISYSAVSKIVERFERRIKTDKEL